MNSRIINIYTAILLALSPLSLFAQDPAMYIYRTNGAVNGFLMSQVDSMTYSNIGLDSVKYDVPVVQQIWTKDGLYQVALSEIDSIGYYTPEPVFKSGLFIIDENNMGQVAEVDFKTMTISFLGSTPQGELPKNGQVIFCDLANDTFPMGFSGRVTNIKDDGGKHIFECEVAGPEEVYDRLLLVGHVGTEGHRSNMPGKRLLKKGHWDGSYKIETGKLFDKLDISGKGTLSFDYTINLNAFNSEPVYVWYKKKHEFEVGFKVNLVDDDNMVGGIPSNWTTGETMKEVWSEPVSLVSYLGVINVDVRLGCYFSYGNKFSVEASGLKWKYLDIEEYERVGDNKPERISDYHEAGWDFDPFEDNLFDVLKFKAELEGSVSFGLCAELAVDIWKPNWLALALGIKVGPELKGSIAIDTDHFKGSGSDAGNTAVYKFLSEDMKLTLGCKLGVDLKARAGGKEYQIAKNTTTLFPKTVTLLPKLTKPELPKIYEFSPNQFMLDVYGGWDSNHGWNSDDPLSVSTIAKNQTLFPGYVGLSFYDEDGQKMDEYYSDSGDWTWNWQYSFGKSIKGLSPQKIKVYPMFKILNIFPVKAEPSIITIPKPFSLSTHSVETKVDRTETVTINDGWGYYRWSSTDENIASLVVKEKDGDKVIEIQGVRPGSATVKVEDVRSGATESFDLKVRSSGLELSTYDLTMNPQDVRTVTVFPKGEYQLNNSNPSVVTVKLLPQSYDGRNSSVIQVTGLEYGSCSVSVTDPQNENSLTFNVNVTDTYLKPGVLNIEPEIINFGDVPAEVTRTEQFVISNSGEKVLKFRINNTCKEFDVQYSNNGVRTIEPGESLTIDVKFTPSQVDQDYECDVVIQTDADNGNQVLKLKGHSVEPTHAIINVTPSVVDFGEVEVNTNKTMQFTISNTGDSKTFFSIDKPSENVFIIPASEQDITIFAERENTYNVIFTPDQVGKEYTCNVTITTDAENGNQTLTLKGKGKEYEAYVHGCCSGFTPEDGALVDASSGTVLVMVKEVVLQNNGENIFNVNLSEDPSVLERGKTNCQSCNITWNGKTGETRSTGFDHWFYAEPGKKYYWQVEFWDWEKGKYVKCSPVFSFTTMP